MGCCITRQLLQKKILHFFSPSVRMSGKKHKIWRQRNQQKQFLWLAMLNTLMMVKLLKRQCLSMLQIKNY